MATTQEEYVEVAKAKKLRRLLSHPAYSHDDDGMGDLATKEVLTFTVQGKVFADEAYLAKNFRSSETKPRDTRRLRALLNEISPTLTALEEYCNAYRSI